MSDVLSTVGTLTFGGDSRDHENDSHSPHERRYIPGYANVSCQGCDGFIPFLLTTDGNMLGASNSRVR